MEKKLQVFISSTYLDLKIERQEVVEAILNADHIPAGMELFKPGPAQETIIREWVEASDVYVLILGPRYGSLNEDGVSFTQWEFELAIELGKPMFSIVLEDSYINQMVTDGRINGTELETSKGEYINFKRIVQQSLNAQISHIAEIRSKVSDSLRDIEKRFKGQLEGWIPGKYLSELEELRIENKELSEKLVARQDDVIEMQKELSVVKDEYIGGYSYLFLKQQFRIQFPLNQLDKTMEYLKNEIKESLHSEFRSSDFDEIYLEKLVEMSDLNLIEIILKYKKEFVGDGFSLYQGAYYELISDNFLTKFVQYDIGSMKPGAYIYLNANGNKFLTMLELDDDL